MIYLPGIRSLRSIVCFPLLAEGQRLTIVCKGPLAVNGFVQLSELDENVHRNFRVGIQQIQLEQVCQSSVSLNLALTVETGYSQKHCRSIIGQSHY